MNNKKAEGIINIIWLIGILFLLLIGGLFLAFGVTIINWTADEIVPEISNLGQVGSANLTSIAGYTVTPANSFIQSFTWLAGVVYIFALIACFGLAIGFRITGNRWLMGFFIACMLMLIITAIFISNIYEEFYNGSDDVGDRLHEQTLLSFLILYSPMIMCIIGFVCGIIMFTEKEEATA